MRRSCPAFLFLIFVLSFTVTYIIAPIYDGLNVYGTHILTSCFHHGIIDNSSTEGPRKQNSNIMSVGST